MHLEATKGPDETVLMMLHSNPAMIEGDRLVVDRKFHLGMQRYLDAISAPVLTVHPPFDAGSPMMDPVRLRLRDLGYRVMTLRPRGHAADRLQLDSQIRNSRLLYYCGGRFNPAIARRLNIPYILTVECDVRTQLAIAASEVPGTLRKVIRGTRRLVSCYTTGIPAMRGADSLHCNGFPVYEEAAKYNRHRLLYLDSRLTSTSLISVDQVKARLQQHGRRPLRLLFSGRFEPLKGAVDVIRAGLDCLRRGLDIELHCFGEGSLKAEMKRVAGSANSSGPRIMIHDTVPFDELQQFARTCDAFVCCHIQGDPSCTYLESFGAGLPVAGYANRMWQRLQSTSGAGTCTPPGQPHILADHLERYVTDAALLAEHSLKALDYAAAHTFEREFALRTDSLNEALSRAGPISCKTHSSRGCRA